jgi:hypothetical protein
MAITGLLFQLPLYLTNTWYTGYLPFNSNRIYNREGKKYDAKAVTDDRANFSLEKFLQYSVFDSYFLTIATLRNSRLHRQICLLLCNLH